MPELHISTDDGKVAALILISDEDITIFHKDHCQFVPVESTDKTSDGVQICRRGCPEHGTGSLDLVYVDFPERDYYICCVEGCEWKETDDRA